MLRLEQVSVNVVIGIPKEKGAAPFASSAHVTYGDALVAKRSLDRKGVAGFKFSIVVEDRRAVVMDGAGLADAVRMFSHVELSDLPPDDLFVANQIGLFFAKNTYLASHVHRIVQITLVENGYFPVSDVTFSWRGHESRHTSKADGFLHIPQVLPQKRDSGKRSGRKDKKKRR